MKKEINNVNECKMDKNPSWQEEDQTMLSPFNI